MWQYNTRGYWSSIGWRLIKLIILPGVCACVCVCAFVCIDQQQSIQWDVAKEITSLLYLCLLLSLCDIGLSPLTTLPLVSLFSPLMFASSSSSSSFRIVRRNLGTGCCVSLLISSSALQPLSRQRHKRKCRVVISFFLFLFLSWSFVLGHMHQPAYSLH